jgi:hypothetical protein
MRGGLRRFFYREFFWDRHSKTYGLIIIHLFCILKMVDSICDDDHKSAYHEAGHVVFANMIGLPICSATIKNWSNRAETQETLMGKLTLKFAKFSKVNRVKCVVYYLSGGRVQEYFCKDGERHPCDEKEIMSCGNIPEIKLTAERYIDEKLSDPVIRRQIQDVAHVLLDKQYHYNLEFLEIIKNSKSS